MTTVGTVREWHTDEGWGVIDSDATPGGCWAHFSTVLMNGYRSLSPGQPVSFEFETGRQDGYDYRAVAVWTGNDRPAAPAPRQPSAAYRSVLRLEFDAPTGGDAPNPAGPWTTVSPVVPAISGSPGSFLPASPAGSSVRCPG